MSVALRPAAAEDFPAIQAIYAYHVLHGLGSFEELPPDIAELRRRHAMVQEAGLPWLVAERSGQVAAFAYAAAYRPRPAYRYTVEDSVYVAEVARGGGLGRLLLANLIEQCSALGRRQMLAVIGDSANLPSIRLHQVLGFREAGVLRAVGFKFGRWVDTVLMQLPLGPGEGEPPDA